MAYESTDLSNFCNVLFICKILLRIPLMILSLRIKILKNLALELAFLNVEREFNEVDKFDKIPNLLLALLFHYHTSS